MLTLFDEIKKFFAQPETEIVGESEHPELNRVVILLEAAVYDSEFHQEERDMIDRLLRDKYQVPQAELHDLLKLAWEKRDQFPDIHAFTRLANERMSVAEKKELMTEIWQIILADNRVDSHEEHFARKMQALLRLDHPTWIACKLEAKSRQE